MKSTPARIGWMIALLFAAAFAGMCWAVFGQGPLPHWDENLAERMQAYGNEHGLVRGLMIGFTHAGGVLAMVMLALVGVLWQLRQKRFLMAAAWVFIVAGGALLNQGLKMWLDRPRPPADWRDVVVTETNESFPSGHAMGSLIGYGMLIYAVCLTERSRKTKVRLLVLAGLLVALVGFSRIFLRAHWFSDVMAGFMIGIAWLALCLGLLETRRRRAPESSTSTPKMANP